MHGFDLFEYIVSNGFWSVYSSNSVLYTVQVHIETIAHPNNCQRFFLSLRIPFFDFTQIFARITDNSLTSLLFLSKYCAKTNWARIRSAIISVQASLSNIQGFLHLVICSSAHWMLFSAHLQTWNTPLSLISYKKVQLLWQSGINCTL